MWRRIIIIMISFTLFSNLVVSSSDGMEDNLCNDIIMCIAPYVAEDENATITRGDCVTTIMKLVGVDKTAAETYADMDFDQPVFLDIVYSDTNVGYIILAKFSDVAVGIKPSGSSINNFEPNRNTTVKECLAFMLRCLIEQNTITWDDVMSQAKETGLLNEDEYNFLNSDGSLTNKDFYKFLSRMLDMNRYLYWPTEEPQPGHAKSMQIDTSKRIKFIDWIAENSSN